MNGKDKILFDFSELRPFLYVAGYGCITDSKLRQFGITHAIDATNLEKPKRVQGVEYLEVKVDDSNVAPITNYFEKACQFIDEAKAKGGKVVIFCAAGVSRSATLAIIYLVLRENLSLRDAYYALNQVRPIVSPNIGFWRQMIDCEQKTRGSSSVQLLRGRTPRPVPDVYLHRSLTYNA